MAEYNSCANLIKDQEKVNEILDLRNDSKDPLQDMLDTQEWLQSVLAEKLPKHNINPSEIQTKGELVKWIDGNFDAILDEYRELKTSIGGMSNGEKAASSVWKKWKANHDEMINENISDMSDDDRMEMLMEFVDCFHFVLNIAIGLGMSSQDLYVLYMLKNHENAKRYKNSY